MRLAPLPPSTMFAFGTRPVLEELAVKFRLPAAVSRSPTVTGSGPVAVSPSIVRFGRPDSVGGSLTGLTVSINTLLEVAPPGSLTVTVTLAEPFWLAVGRSVTVRLEALPPKAIPERGSNPGLDEVALRLSWVGG